MTGASARDEGVQQWGQLYRPLFLFPDATTNKSLSLKQCSKSNKLKKKKV